MQDMLAQKGERKRIQATLRRLFADPMLIFTEN
jgi:hypothetical protein